MTVGVVGLGLIGGSIGLALRAPERTIIGFDQSPSAGAMALGRFCADRLGTLDEVAEADIVFVAVPPAYVIPTLDAVYARKSPQTVVTDCASVKADVAAWALEHKLTDFVPGHPMAGHEKSGASYASAWMFRGAKWLVCPTAKTAKAATGRVEAIIREMGAEPVRIDAEEHDRQIAVLSHLPHAFAAVLVTLAANIERTDVAGGSWRDLTRVGGVDPELWTQISIGNRQELAKALAASSEMLSDLAQALAANDAAAVHAFFTRARLAKR